MSEFFRVTFLPKGAQRKVSFWAERVRSHKNGTVLFRKVTKEGESTDDFLLVNQTANIRPAAMNLHYGELEVVEN